jgi:hypothetical protein
MKSTDVVPLVVYGLPLMGLLILSLLKPNAASQTAPRTSSCLEQN